MSYTKLNLTDGTTLTAEHLKHIEEGIAAAAPADTTYTKNQIDTMLGSYVNDIDTLIGGES